MTHADLKATRPVPEQDSELLDIHGFLTDRGIHIDPQDNPFEARPIRSGDTFYLDHPLVPDIVEGIKKDRFAIIQGSLGSGKTSLAHVVGNHLLQVPSAGFTSHIMVNMQEEAWKRGEDLVQRVQSTIERNKKAEGHAVIVVDELVITNRYPDAQLRVLSYLNSLRDQGHAIVLLVNGDVRNTDRTYATEVPIEAKQSMVEMAGSGDSIYTMKRLSADALRQFAGGGEPPVFTDRVIQKIVQESGGSIHLAQIIARRMFDRARAVGSPQTIESVFSGAHADAYNDIDLRVGPVVDNLIAAGFDPETGAYVGEEQDRPTYTEVFENALPSSISSSVFREWLKHRLDAKYMAIRGKKGNRYVPKPPQQIREVAPLKPIPPKPPRRRSSRV